MGADPYKNTQFPSANGEFAGKPPPPLLLQLPLILISALQPKAHFNPILMSLEFLQIRRPHRELMILILALKSGV